MVFIGLLGLGLRPGLVKGLTARYTMPEGWIRSQISTGAFAMRKTILLPYCHLLNPFCFQIHPIKTGVAARGCHRADSTRHSTSPFEL